MYLLDVVIILTVKLNKTIFMMREYNYWLHIWKRLAGIHDGWLDGVITCL